MPTAHDSSKHLITAVVHRRLQKIKKPDPSTKPQHRAYKERQTHSLDEESAGAGSKSELKLLVRLQGQTPPAPSSRPRQEMLYSRLDVTRRSGPGVRTRGSHCSPAGAGSEISLTGPQTPGAPLGQSHQRPPRAGRRQVLLFIAVTTNKLI